MIGYDRRYTRYRDWPKPTFNPSSAADADQAEYCKFPDDVALTSIQHDKRAVFVDEVALAFRWEKAYARDPASVANTTLSYAEVTPPRFSCSDSFDMPWTGRPAGSVAVQNPTRATGDAPVAKRARQDA